MQEAKVGTGALWSSEASSDFSVELCKFCSHDQHADRMLTSTEESARSSCATILGKRLAISACSTRCSTPAPFEFCIHEQNDHALR